VQTFLVFHWSYNLFYLLLAHINHFRNHKNAQTLIFLNNFIVFQCSLWFLQFFKKFQIDSWIWQNNTMWPHSNEAQRLTNWYSEMSLA
jgi:hypothetical protein